MIIKITKVLIKFVRVTQSVFIKYIPTIVHLVSNASPTVST